MGELVTEKRPSGSSKAGRLPWGALGLPLAGPLFPSAFPSRPSRLSGSSGAAH